MVLNLMFFIFLIKKITIFKQNWLINDNVYMPVISKIKNLFVIIQ